MPVFASGSATRYTAALASKRAPGALIDLEGLEGAHPVVSSFCVRRRMRRVMHNYSHNSRPPRRIVNSARDALKKSVQTAVI